MAKFCTQCGKRLEAGEVCSCGSGQRGDSVPGEQNVRIHADNGQAGSAAAGQQATAEPAYNNTYNNGVQSGNAQAGNAQYGGQPSGAAQYNNAAGAQQAYNAQGFNNQGGSAYQQYNGQQGAPDNRWQAEMSRQTVAGAKNMFAQFTEIITRPVSGAMDLTKTNAPIPGLAFIIIKAAVILLAVIFGAKKLEEVSYYWYVDIPYAKLVILILLITLGADLLEGVLLKALSGAFGVRTDSKAAFACVAARTVYEIILMIVFGIIFKLSAGLALTLYTVCSLILPYIEFGGYYSMSDGDSNKKIFAFFIVKACIFVIVYLLVKNVGLDILMQIAGGAYSDIVSEFSDALDWLNML